MRSAPAEVAWAKLGNAMNRYAASKAKCDEEMAEVRDFRAVAVKDALRNGMSTREIGSLIGVSHTRVQQIANEES